MRRRTVLYSPLLLGAGKLRDARKGTTSNPSGLDETGAEADSIECIIPGVGCHLQDPAPAMEVRIGSVSRNCPIGVSAREGRAVPDSPDLVPSPEGRHFMFCSLRVNKNYIKLQLVEGV
jgi:hypothetical protein